MLFCRLALAATLPAQTNDIRFEHISVEHGLSNFALTKIAQDARGFLWFGTEDGLNKYDGHEFIVYKPDAADSNSLPDRFVQALCADGAGNLWVGAGHDGPRRYDPETGKFERFKHDPQNPQSLAGTFVSSLLADSRDELWIGTHTGLYRFSHRTGALTAYRHNPHDTATISSDVIAALCEDRKGNLWIGTSRDGINRYDRGRNAFLRLEPQNGANLRGIPIMCLRGDPLSPEVIWIGTNAGLYQYNSRTNMLVRHDPLPDTIFDLYEDSHGILWIATFHLGLWRYEAASGRFFQYAHDPGDPHSLSEDRISCVFEDRSGVMWMGTYRRGLNRYDRGQEAFTRYPSGEAIYAVRQDRNGELWLGTAGAGLLRHDRQGRLVAHYRHEPGNPESLSTYGILALQEDSKGELWIGTGRGLNRYDARRRRFIRYPHEPLDAAAPDHYEVKVIHEDAGGRLWIGTKGSGLCLLDREKKSFTYYRRDPKNPQSIGGNSIWAIGEDKKGDLWIGTFDGGLSRLDMKTGAFIRYQHDPQNPRSLNNNAIYSVYADTSGAIWVGTYGSGLNRLEANSGQVLHYTDKEGLADNYVKSILPDASGNLWLSTDKGLSKFNPQNGTFKNYTVRDGLISNQFLSGAYYKSPEGRLFFGGEKGVIAFYPDSLKDNPHPPPVAITRFNIFGKPLPGAPSPLREIKLSHRQNFFSFDFVALDYVDPARNQYAYKLEGFDPDWVPCGTRRYASYTNVEPGEYLFRVKGANSDGVWNEEGAAVAIVITPPFWRTWWFRALAAIAVAAAGFGLYRYRVSRLLEMERLRTRLAADLHDEIAGNLSSIAMFGQIIYDKAAGALDKNSAEPQLLQRLIALAQESVTSIREIIWAIDPKTETMHDLLLRVRDMAVTACRAQNMILRFEMPPLALLPAKNLSPEQRKHLWLLLKEAVHNAVQHSGGTELAIYASYKAGQMHVSIVDNGSGLEGGGSAAGFSGRGLQTMTARAQQLQGSFGLFSDASGTTVNVTIKI